MCGIYNVGEVGFPMTIQLFSVRRPRSDGYLSNFGEFINITGQQPAEFSFGSATLESVTAVVIVQSDYRVLLSVTNCMRLNRVSLMVRIKYE